MRKVLLLVALCIGILSLTNADAERHHQRRHYNNHNNKHYKREVANAHGIDHEPTPRHHQQDQQSHVHHDQLQSQAHSHVYPKEDNTRKRIGEGTVAKAVVPPLKTHSQPAKQHQKQRQHIHHDQLQSHVHSQLYPMKDNTRRHSGERSSTGSVVPPVKTHSQTDKQHQHPKRHRQQAKVNRKIPATGEEHKRHRKYSGDSLPKHKSAQVEHKRRNEEGRGKRRQSKRHDVNKKASSHQHHQQER